MLCLAGPPGTGKTSTLVEAATQVMFAVVLVMRQLHGGTSSQLEPPFLAASSHSKAKFCLNMVL
jgi:DNA polymerase III delta prime subunit